MKIHRNNIDKAIKVLQDFKNDLKGEEYYEYKNKKLIKQKFIIPERFGVKAENEDNANIIYPYTEHLSKQGFNTSTKNHWTIYCICEFKDGKIKITGNDSSAYTKMPIISPEDFIKHIVNENL